MIMLKLTALCALAQGRSLGFSPAISARLLFSRSCARSSNARYGNPVAVGFHFREFTARPWAPGA